MNAHVRTLTRAAPANSASAAWDHLDIVNQRLAAIRDLATSLILLASELCGAGTEGNILSTIAGEIVRSAEEAERERSAAARAELH